MRTLKECLVFLASPGGLEDYRFAFRKELREFNHADAQEREFLFTPVLWEDTLRGEGRPQDLINQRLSQCDFFVLLLWDRWGSPPGGDGIFSSGSEEEWNLALKCHKAPELPMRRLLTLFRGIHPRMMADPGPQLRKVMKFRGSLEDGEGHFYQQFDTLEEFCRLIRRHLAGWLRDEESQRGLNVPDLGPPVPPPFGRPSTPSSDAELQEALGLAEQGRLTEAETLFAQATVAWPDPEALNRYGIFLLRLGRLEQASLRFERLLALPERFGDTWKAKAYSNLGLISRTRGDIEEAQRLHKKSLELDERLGNREGVAISFGNLGEIARTRGDLEEAEDLQREALRINQELENRAGVAWALWNLGVLSHDRDELELARRFLRQSLEIYKSLENRVGEARCLGTLGVLALRQGDLGEAKLLHSKALGIHEKAGSAGGLAQAYGNLGSVALLRGDLKEAKTLFRKALASHTQVESSEGIAWASEKLADVQCRLEEPEEIGRH